MTQQAKIDNLVAKSAMEISLNGYIHLGRLRLFFIYKYSSTFIFADDHTYFIFANNSIFLDSLGDIFKFYFSILLLSKRTYFRIIPSSMDTKALLKLVSDITHLFPNNRHNASFSSL